MKVRIFALAKELGMDSKVLIKHCNNAGVRVKSSALASISPEERDIVIAHLKSLEPEKTEASPQTPLTPERDRARMMSRKVRTIRTMVPRAQSPRLGRAKSAESAPAHDETPEAEPAADQVAAAEAASPTSDDTATGVIEPPEAIDASSEADASAPMVSEADHESVETAAADAVDADSSVELETPSEASDETQTDELVEVSEPPDTTDASAAEDPGEKIAPITREDYVPIAGSNRDSIRDMGTGQGGGRAGRKPKGRLRPALPTLAAPPSFKTPKGKTRKPAEERAQKPDLKLTADILEQQSPLAAHLKKHSEQKRHGKKDADTGTDQQEGKRGRERSGVGLVESRQQRRERRTASRQDTNRRTSRTSAPRRRRQQRGPIELKTSAQIELPITVRGLSEAMGRPASTLLKVLFSRGTMLTINDNLDEETALELAMEVGVDLEIKKEQDIEDALTEMLQSDDDAAESIESRPPVITILGHVDHGKTSLLDKIRSANVASGEAGGITQHIASYQVEHDGKKLTFVDTPGHAAFGEMRARGANVTDIVVLVVAADDGVMPQTVECISHAKAAGAPIVVALNKIDLPDMTEERISKILADLAGHEVVPQEWGGDVEVVRTSAATGQGVDDLIETLLLTAELHEFKATPDRAAVGVCLEAFRDEGRGVLAWLIVQNGTLRVGDVLLCGKAYGRIRAMYNDRDEEVMEVGPSTPVRVAGLDTVPGAGDHFFVLEDIEHAREAADTRRDRGRAAELSQRGRPRTLDDILNAARDGATQELPLIVKADTPGSLEAIKSELDKLEHPEVKVSILHQGVGGVNESDVYLASASHAIIVAFQVIAEDRALVLAEREHVEIRRYSIIYEVTDQIKRVLEGLLTPERVEVPTGRALVMQTFNISRMGTIAGCRVLTGTIGRSNRVHVIRDQKVLNSYPIASLRREQDDVKEVRDGMECGIRLDGFNDVKEGDLLEAFRVDEVKRTLDGKQT